LFACDWVRAADRLLSPITCAPIIVELGIG
jgi:hypothetical protein